MTEREQLPKTYDAAMVEAAMYEAWESSGAFTPRKAQPDSGTTPFVIALPPPNATGTLHLGHAAMLAIEDLLIRYHRLRGVETLWVPGTDHAAIATQNVVEKQMWKEEKKTRHDLGREALVQKIDTFVETSRDTIRSQVRRMGASLDWSREHFTLEPALTRCVRMVFTMMYEDGLVYRGNRIVNWCTRCQTTLADDEVEYKEEKTPFYHFRFGPFSIGTVRPETKLGDKYVVVHPDDKRFTAYHGLKQMIPWISGDVEMHVLPDESADPEMGSGAMTITPQHSFADFETAQKHGLEIKENIIGLDGKLTEATGEFAGLPVREARDAFVEILKAKGLIEKIDEDYVHNLSVCYRCGTPVEPLVSRQWFVNVNAPVARLGGKTLRQRASEAVHTGEITIIPERFEKIYHNWMDNLHDWCISRQIWYGHRIPVWYKQKAVSHMPYAVRNSLTPATNEGTSDDIYVGVEAPGGEGWEQDPDTLDTWFSSSMWTFSTLLNRESTATDLAAWREDSPDLKRYHPTSVLETGYDIIFFWVARMILMTTYAMNEVPFRTVYLHGLIRDKQGRKMSKSLGNGIDPVEMIDTYGADAVRLSLVIGTTPGNDVRLYEEKIAGYRNFVNKLWNISRYILTTTKADTAPGPQTRADRWIQAEWNETKRRVTDHLAAYRFSPAGELLYDFTWKKLADWYLEVAKIEKGKDALLRTILGELLVLWHPFTPFVTEHIWQLMGEREQLISASWPRYEEHASHDGEFSTLQTVVANIRDMKQEVKRLDTLAITYHPTHGNDVVTEERVLIETLAGATLTISSDPAPQDCVRRVVVGGVLTTDAAIPVDTARQAAERHDLEAYTLALRERLASEAFRSRAPAAVIAKEEARLKEAEERLRQL